MHWWTCGMSWIYPLQKLRTNAATTSKKMNLPWWKAWLT